MQRPSAAIRVPTLPVHSEKDVETPIAHPERVLAARAGPERLIRVRQPVTTGPCAIWRYRTLGL